MTKGPLGKISTGFLLIILFNSLAVFLFAYISIKTEQKQVSLMQSDIPAIIKLNTAFSRYPRFNTVSYTQDGSLVLYDSAGRSIGTLRVQSKEETAVLRHVRQIYRDDYGVVFLYGENFFTVIPRIIFSHRSLDELQKKRSANEIVTEIDSGVYMMVYEFDYRRFFSPTQIFLQVQGIAEGITDAVKGVSENG